MGLLGGGCFGTGFRREEGRVDVAEVGGAVVAVEAGLLEDGEGFLLALAGLEDVAIEVREIGELGRIGVVRIGLGWIEGKEIEVRSVGATLDEALVGGAGGFGVGGAEFGIGEVKAFGGAEESEIFFHVGEGAAAAEVFEDACFDGGADRAEEGIGVLFVADVGGGGDLGEDGAVRIRLGCGEETAESGRGGADVEAAFGAGFAEKIDDFLVGMVGAEVEDELAVVLGKGGELVSGFRDICIHIRRG